MTIPRHSMITLGLAMLLGFPAQAADANSPDKIWHQRPTEDNIRDCSAAGAPAWCASWLWVMEAGRLPVVDNGAPEWKRMAVEGNLGTCNAVGLLPDWCKDWKSYMVEISRQAPYRAALEAYLASEQAKADVRAFERAKKEAWLAMASRIAAGYVLPEDRAEIDRRLGQGDTDAMELLAWMHVQGVGVRVRDFAKAYELYAQAVMAGRKDLQPNLDKLWSKLIGSEKEAMLARFNTPEPPP
ncbi:MAG TPA: hypothetical protein VEB64_16465 [Azospirillaceae bacterium]|nr:hypothetical protein [Azospirillaceae bacterium]